MVLSIIIFSNVMLSDHDLLQLISMIVRVPKEFTVITGESCDLAVVGKCNEYFLEAVKVDLRS